MEYYNGKLCTTVKELTAVMTYSSYRKSAERGRIDVARQGKGSGNYALIVVETLPEDVKQKLEATYPQMDKMRLVEWIRSNYILDSEARAFFSAFRFDNGNTLPKDKINEYTVNASVIQCIIRLKNNAAALRRASKAGTIQWDEVAQVIAACKEEYGHTLPENPMRFRKKVAEFNKCSYECLISGKFGNQSARKVDYKTERLILSLDSLPNRPFNTTVHELYMQFVCGELDVYDPETGELINPDDFTDKKGNPLALSETTIANYLNNPKNRVLRAKEHSTGWEFNNEYRPHHHRISPSFAFSKISLDDRDLPRKMPDGNRVKAYYAYDVASGCVIGYAYNRLKTGDLFIDCIRNMFQLIDQQGWNCPAEVEVEHHLVNNFADGLISAGNVFPFVRWCNPGNSQEKRAEHFNRAKKYGVEKKLQVGIGRWYASLEANRPKIEKVYDEKNNTYKEATYSFEQLVADDILAIREYNNQLHPNQAYYKGMTRWDVLCKMQNPDLRPVDKAILYQYIGERTHTSIRRSMYCTVRGGKYQLPSPELLSRLAPNDYEVDAFYMPDESGKVSEVYLYQGGRFIARCESVKAYQEAKAEQTEEDKQNYTEQAKYVAQFDAMVRRDRITKVKVSR
ncbi:MAG: hypothetical protein ACI3ZN_02540, partial [Candidatus Cryptobacteroides sp.]